MMMMKRRPDIVKMAEAEMARLPQAPHHRGTDPAKRKTVNRLLGLNGDAQPKD